MDAAAWREEFARREAQWRFGRAMHWASISAERVPAAAKSEIVPVVLEADHEVDAGDGLVPSSARSAARAAAAVGWFPVELRAALAAVPGRGLVRTLSLRARRHDERFFAIWRGGAFEVAWYVGPGGLERLGGERMKADPAQDAVSVDEMTLPAIKALAAERGIKIPSKFKKSEVLDFVKASGLSAGAPTPKLRGVMDAIEGVRGPRQWLAQFAAAEREQTAAAVGLISQAFPGLQLMLH